MIAVALPAMGIRGSVLAVVAAAIISVAGLAACSGSKPQPTSDRIKASAQAALDASMLEGRKEQLALLQTGGTPSNSLCRDLWAKKTKAEQAKLLQGAWLAGCVETPGQ
jgi:hypothetical protein